MSLESLLSDLTAAVKENSELLRASGGASATEPATTEKKPAARGGRKPKTTAEDKAAAKTTTAAKPGTTGRKRTKKVDVEVRDSIDAPELRKLAGGYLKTDDEALRNERRTQMASAFEHLGVDNLAAISDDEDMIRMALYLDTWIAGGEVDFEALDGKAAEATGGDDDDDSGDDDDGDGDEDGDDLLG